MYESKKFIVAAFATVLVLLSIVHIWLLMPLHHECIEDSPSANLRSARKRHAEHTGFGFQFESSDSSRKQPRSMTENNIKQNEPKVPEQSEVTSSSFETVSVDNVENAVDNKQESVSTSSVTDMETDDYTSDFRLANYDSGHISSSEQQQQQQQQPEQEESHASVPSFTGGYTPQSFPIALVAYNRPDYLRRSLKSLLHDVQFMKPELLTVFQVC